MHLLAHHLIGPMLPSGIDPDRSTLILVTGSALLSWSLTLSQAMEMVTRAFYARADLDLMLSSPASARKVFAVRIMAIALSTTALAVPLAAPFINVLAYAGGPRWLGAYGVVVAMGLAASALAVALDGRACSARSGRDGRGSSRRSWRPSWARSSSSASRRWRSSPPTRCRASPLCSQTC